MTLFNLRDAVDSLDDLLDREKAAILGGDFGVLDRMAKEKKRLLAAVSKPGAKNRLDRLKAKAERNKTMLMAAANGIRAVSERLANRGVGNQAFQTYDKGGQRRIQPNIRGNLERRA